MIVSRASIDVVVMIIPFAKMPNNSLVRAPPASTGIHVVRRVVRQNSGNDRLDWSTSNGLNESLITPYRARHSASSASALV